MTDTNFELHPKEGYGLFRFRTTVAENRPYSSTYGDMRDRSLFPVKISGRECLIAQQMKRVNKIF